MKIGDKIKVEDKSKAEHGEPGKIIDLQTGVEHVLVSVALDKGGQRLFTACSLTGGRCSCGAEMQTTAAPGGLLG